VPVAARSKAWACGRLLPGTAYSNPAGGMDVCVVCCTIRTNSKSQDNRNKEVRIKYKERTKKWQAAGLLPRKPGFDHEAGRMRLVVDTVSLNCPPPPRLLSFPLLVDPIIPPMLHTHPNFNFRK
jgi:hypothetical protein